MKTLAVVIPAYNEEKAIGAVLGSLTRIAATLNATVVTIVVDDGSSDRTTEVAESHGAIVVRHIINRGLGATLSTGITAACAMLAKQALQHAVIVTLDADGQHDPAELSAVISPIFSGEAQVVLGSRFVGGHRESMPWHRTVANRLANAFTGFLFGVWVSDTQSGYRAFSLEAARALNIRTNTMEVSSEIVREIGRNKWRLKEVPITVAYTEYSLSKGQGFLKGLETLWKLIILRFFR